MSKNGIKDILLIATTIALIIAGFVIKDQNKSIATDRELMRELMRKATTTMEKAYEVILEQNQMGKKPIIEDSNSISLEK